MRRHLSMALLTLGIAGLVVGCDDDDPTGPDPERFTATLNGANERPTPRTTPAQGTANFSLLNDVLSWDITLTSITNVTAAHIHVGGATVASGVILLLTPSGPSNTRITGSITKAAFVPQTVEGEQYTWDEMLALMRTGGAYVNVHTNLTTNDPTNNSGPGDFPGGEIRGQINRVP